MRNYKAIFLILVLVLLLLSIRPYYKNFIAASSCQLDPFFENEGKYYWMFKKDSVLNISRFYSIGNSETNEFVFGYNYAEKYRFIIREVKLFDNIELHKVVFRNNFFADKINFNASTSFGLDMGPFVEMESKTCLIRIHSMKINFGSFKEIEKRETTNAVIYKGKFSQYGITDENDEYQMFTTFKEVYPPESALILFKKTDSFYVILVNSVNNKYPIDNAIELLNLN